MKKLFKRRRRMQAVLTYFTARRRQLITVCAPLLFSSNGSDASIFAADWRATAAGSARSGLLILPKNSRNLASVTWDHWLHGKVWPAKPPCFSSKTLSCLLRMVSGKKKTTGKYVVIIYAIDSPVHTRSFRLNQARLMVEPTQVRSAVAKWFRRNVNTHVKCRFEPELI